MKTVILFLFAFIITFSSSNPQSRNGGTAKKTEDKTDVEKVPIKEVQRTPPPINDRDTRVKPPDPSNRRPVNNTPVQTPPTGRLTSPPSNIVSTPEPPHFIEFIPIPDYYTDPIGEPVYSDPIETTPAITPVQDFLRLGLSQFNAEDYYNALASFQLALAEDSLQYAIYYNIGITEIEIGRYDDAIFSLTMFIDNVIENRLGFYQRGLAYFYSGDRDAALDDFLVADQYKVDAVKVILKRFYDYY